MDCVKQTICEPNPKCRYYVMLWSLEAAASRTYTRIEVSAIEQKSKGGMPEMPDKIKSYKCITTNKNKGQF